MIKEDSMSLIKVAVSSNQTRMGKFINNNNNLRLYDVLTGNFIKDLVSHGKEISSLLYCVDDRYLFKEFFV